MNFFEKYNIKISSILKVIGIAILAIIVLVVVFRLVGSSFNSISGRSTGSALSNMQRGEIAMDVNSADVSMKGIGVAPATAPLYGSGTTGDQAEEFEITDYSATIETEDIDDTCAEVSNLKAKEYVIFENAYKNDRGCNYTFKVKKENVEEILSAIKEMEPKSLSENTYTIKKSVDTLTNRVEILKKKLATIDETLNNAINAYDNITALATRVQDIESLAKIINSKISIIERLTQERMNINAQLEQIEKTKLEQLDRLDYTYFYINVVENKFVNEKDLEDSWRNSVKEFVRDINSTIQDITINLVASLFKILQYIIYLVILVVVAKYGWEFVRYIWKK